MVKSDSKQKKRKAALDGPAILKGISSKQPKLASVVVRPKQPSPGETSTKQKDEEGGNEETITGSENSFLLNNLLSTNNSAQIVTRSKFNLGSGYVPPPAFANFKATGQGSIKCK